MANPPNTVKIHVTGRSAFPGELTNYVTTTEPRPNILQKALGRIGDIFMNLLPDRGGKATVADDSLVIKTSPTLWPYEIFKLNADRRIEMRELDELMRLDPRIKRANRVHAATAVRKGFTVTVTSQVSEELAEKAQDVVNQVVHDCQINSKLASWARILLKEGDLFLNLVIDVETLRIKNVKRLPSISMERNEDMMGNFQDLSNAFQQIDPISLDVLEEFSLFSILHIRWDHEEGMLYGNSQYRQIRGYWKKLNMGEEDIVVRRRSRATPRRLHKIGDKEHPGSNAEIETYKKRNNIEAKTANVITDYFGNGLTDIKDLDGDPHLGDIADIQHIQEVYQIGLGVPLHLLGFGQNVNRDIVNDQKQQFREDCQELRDLLEYGDSSQYSGLRSLFDFALSLQGLDPSLVSYNFAWYAADDETATDRVDRVIKLRATQPKPLISQRLALQTIGRDLNLESEEAVEAEQQRIEEELAQDKADQTTLQGELNPSKPATRPEDQRIATSLTDSAGRKKKLATRLRGKLIAQLEQRFATRWRRGYAEALAAARPGLERLGVKHQRLTDDDHRKMLVREVLATLAALLRESAEVRKQALLPLLHQAAASGVRAAHLDVRGTAQPLTDNAGSPAAERYVNPETARYLEREAGTRIQRIDETTLRLVRKQLAEAYRNGEEWDSWIDRIESVLDCSKPRGRAALIASYELSSAYHVGLVGTYQELGTELLERLEVEDKRTCQRCAAANGQTYATSEAMGVLPAHPRCRGTFVAAR